MGAGAVDRLTDGRIGHAGGEDKARIVTIIGVRLLYLDYLDI